MIRKLVTMIVAAGLSTAVLAAPPAGSPSHTHATSKTAVKGYTRTLKNGKQVHVHGYTRGETHSSAMKAQPKAKTVKGYTRTTKNGKVVHVKGYTRHAPVKKGAKKA